MGYSLQQGAEAYINIAAIHIIETAKLFLSNNQYTRMMNILLYWKNGIIRQLVAEYMITDIVNRADPLLGADIKQYFENAVRPAEAGVDGGLQRARKRCRVVAFCLRANLFFSDP